MTENLSLPVHPGEVLREEFLNPLGVTAGKLAKLCKVPRIRLERIVAEHTGISGDTSLRLGKVLGTGPEFWMNLQKRYELECAKIALSEVINQLEPIWPTCAEVWSSNDNSTEVKCPD